MKTSAKVIIASSILGFLNAIYLTYLYIEKTMWGFEGKSFCDLSNNFSCSEVILSPFVRLFGAPFFMVALFVYPVMALLGYFALTKKSPGKYFLSIAILSAMGTTMNIAFMNNEWSFVGAICFLCLLCLGFIFIDFVMAIRGVLETGIEKSKKLTM